MNISDPMQEYFEKLAAKRESEQGIYEADLAEKAKFGDSAASKELMERLTPLIEGLVREMGYNSTIPLETLRAEAMNIAQHYIPQYVPTKGASVGTYIRGNVAKKLQTYIQENSSSVRYQGHLIPVVPKIRSVMNYLDGTVGKGNYDVKDIHREMVDMYGKSSKWSVKNIQRIVDNTKTENIGSRLFGEEGVGENITLMDTVNVEENETLTNLPQTLEMNRIFQVARQELTPDEYKLFEAYLKGKQSQKFKPYGLALDFNLSTNDLDSKLKEIRKKINRKL
jgi:DNA-directed RNA polymerase specialized sigma subunit